MSSAKLPERASLEYLKKLAKDRLHELRSSDPRAKLATALLTVARDHGFSSWRALKVEVELRQSRNAAGFFEACAKDNMDALRGLLANDPGLVRAVILRPATVDGQDYTSRLSKDKSTLYGCCLSTELTQMRAKLGTHLCSALGRRTGPYRDSACSA